MAETICPRCGKRTHRKTLYTYVACHDCLERQKAREKEAKEASRPRGMDGSPMPGYRWSHVLKAWVEEAK
jgi:DNA-directed RNA polymerase subunit RPC12/RpoP